MKKLITCLVFLTFLFASTITKAITYTSTGSGNWATGSRWSPTGPPTSGSSAGNKNIIIVQAGHTVTLYNSITLSNVVIYVYGILNMDNSGLNFANITVNGTGSGVIVALGGAIRGTSAADILVNITVNGSNAWNGFWDGNVNATTGQIVLGSGVNDPLPVSLVSWTATLEGESVTTSWTTSEEKNNHYFTIEESTDGTNFSEIAQIASQGNATVSQNYSYRVVPKEKASTLYYRLKQTDLDGKATYFDILKISFASPAATTWSVYPNPVTQREFTVQTSYKGANTISLVDAKTGQELLNRELSFAEADIATIVLPDEIKAGYYVLNILSSEGVESRPLMIY